MSAAQPSEKAYIGPFVVFLAFLLLVEVVGRIGDGYAHWALSDPRHWLFPVQTFVCGVLLWRWRSNYTLGPYRGLGFATIAGIVVLVLWVLPTVVFGQSRTDGFQPEKFGTEGWPYWTTLSLRILRMVVIVPLVEEIFWRGWLLRYLVNEDFRSIPFGTFTWKATLITAGAFCLEHQFADWPAAFAAGLIYNAIAHRTKSLFACVLAHAVTNLGLALYILKTRQWGYW